MGIRSVDQQYGRDQHDWCAGTRGSKHACMHAGWGGTYARMWPSELRLVEGFWGSMEWKNKLAWLGIAVLSRWQNAYNTIQYNRIASRVRLLSFQQETSYLIQRFVGAGASVVVCRTEGIKCVFTNREQGGGCGWRRKGGIGLGKVWVGNWGRGQGLPGRRLSEEPWWV